jgi:hypothetical protein
MDTITIWATKIAEAAAPDEIDLAPIMAEAFIRGGKEKEELFARQNGNVLGGFGIIEGLVIFPLILNAIAITASLTSKILSSEAVENCLSIINNSLEIYNKLKSKQKIETSPKIYTPLKPEIYAPLTDLTDAFSKELGKSGLPQDKCDLITYRVLDTLLKDPSNAVIFVKKVAESNA